MRRDILVLTFFYYLKQLLYHRIFDFLGGLYKEKNAWQHGVLAIWTAYGG